MTFCAEIDGGLLSQGPERGQLPQPIAIRFNRSILMSLASSTTSSYFSAPRWVFNTSDRSTLWPFCRRRRNKATVMSRSREFRVDWSEYVLSEVEVEYKCFSKACARFAEGSWPSESFDCSSRFSLGKREGDKKVSERFAAATKRNTRKQQLTLVLAFAFSPGRGWKENLDSLTDSERYQEVQELTLKEADPLASSSSLKVQMRMRKRTRIRSESASGLG